MRGPTCTSSTSIVPETAFFRFSQPPCKIDNAIKAALQMRWSILARTIMPLTFARSAQLLQAASCHRVLLGKPVADGWLLRNSARAKTRDQVWCNGGRDRGAVELSQIITRSSA